MNYSYNLRRLIQYIYFLSIITAIAPKGSTNHFALFASSVIIALVAFIAIRQTPFRRAVRRLHHSCFAILLLLLCFSFFQAIEFDNNPFAHPAWKQAGMLLNFQHGAISVDPSATRYALITVAAPFIVFISGLALFQSDDDAVFLWQFLAIIGAVFALYGIFRLNYFPSQILWYEKDYATDSLSSVFVNRNTAGTLLGVASLLQFGLIAARAKTRADIFNPKTLALSALLALTLIALFLTKSRGAVLSTLIAFLFVPPLLLSKLRDPHHTARRIFRTSGAFWIARKTLVLTCCVAATLMIFVVFAGRTIFRMELQGTDDARFCVMPGIWRAILDNWLFGTGFGTFENIFPMYRDPQCGIYGVWDRAHNFYLEGLLGLGIGFIPVAIAVYLLIGRTLLQGLRARRSKRFAPVIGVGVVILVTLHSMVDFSLQIHGFAVYTAAALSSILTLCLARTDIRRTKKQVKAKTPPQPDNSTAHSL